MVALLNDTVGTLMALGYTDHDCQIGVIVGKVESLLNKLQI